MSILKTTMLLQVFAANELLDVNKMFTTNKIGDVIISNKLIEKLVELKTGKLSKSQKLSKSKK